MLAGNVARRHDFGFALNDADARARFSWAQPKQDVTPGSPWHVTGSALGLDVALASLALRRVDMGRISAAPTLTSNERQTFAVSVALMSPAELTDADRDAIAAAIARGRARLAAATPATFDALADEIALDGWRRRAVKWSLANDTARAGTMFSLTEMLSLGSGPSWAALDAWGMGAVVTTGCLCTRLRAPGGWWSLTGRPQLGLLATTIADVNLHIAVVLRDLGLPAAIARDVLTAAMQDYIDDVRPSDTNDWLTLVRVAQAIPRERVEDYIAAITATARWCRTKKGTGVISARAPQNPKALTDQRLRHKKGDRSPVLSHLFGWPRNDSRPHFQASRRDDAPNRARLVPPCRARLGRTRAAAASGADDPVAGA